MASSNRHWPSLFKSKPCNNTVTHSQWQHDISPNNIPLVSNNVCHERSPEPKPRWNPKPEQIRILEAIFNSGMVNPPRDEIRKIRAQLQEYGQVGDANVFYWFQNRKSRTKNKQRHLHKHRRHSSPATAPTSSSSSSSNNVPGVGASVCQADIYNYATHGEFQLAPEPTFPQYTQGFCFSELSNVVSAPAGSGPSTNFLLSELMMSHGYGGSSKEVQPVDQAAKNKMETQLMMSSCTTVSSAAPDHTDIAPPPPPSTTVPVLSTVNLVQGDGAPGAVESRPSMMVFINDMAVEVGVGPLNVREAFGDDAVLLNSSGQPVLTDDSGVTLQSLQNGAFYYLIL